MAESVDLGTPRWPAYTPERRPWEQSSRGGTREDRMLRVASRLRHVLLARPVLSAEDACAAVGGARRNVFTARDRLRRAGVSRPLTDRHRGQVWGAGMVLDELQDLGARIERAAR